MEHWEFLKPGGYRFVRDDALFPPGTDTFLLSSLPRLKPNLRVCDLGCGTGLLGLLLLQRQGNLTVTGVELQPEAAALLERASAENGLEGRLTVCRGDLRNIRALLPAGGFDLVVCNPPYYPAGTGKLSPAPALQTARAETACTLKDVCRAAGWLLRWGGAFCLVHKPERLTDLLCALRAAALEPKRLRTVERRAGDARRGGKPGLSWEPPLILETAEGRPTEELDRIYFRQEDMP